MEGHRVIFLSNSIRDTWSLEVITRKEGQRWKARCVNLGLILETVYYKIEFNKVIIGLLDNPAKMIDVELKLEIIRSLITHPNKNLLLEILAIYTK